MVEIKLHSNKHGDKIVLIDDEDYEKTKEHHWWLTKAKNIFYGATKIYIDGKRTTLMMHRFILNLTFKNKEVIDHIDHNGLNNQKYNLRITTIALNNRNRRISKKSLNKYKGVRKKQVGLEAVYKADIKLNGKHIVSEFFKTEIEAACEYDRLAKKYFGEFACLNFPEENNK